MRSKDRRDADSGGGLLKGTTDATVPVRPRCIALTRGRCAASSSTKRIDASLVSAGKHRIAIAAPIPVPRVVTTVQTERRKLLKSGRIDADHGVGWSSRSTYSLLSKVASESTSYSVKYR